MKLVHISDTHQYFPKNLPEADFLCHTGDYSLLPKYSNLETRVKELEKFNDWLGTIKDKYSYILFVPGNHDFIFEKEPDLAEEILTNAVVLNDKGINLLGLNFYGTSSQPIFCNWAFNHDMDTRIKKYAAIPSNTDALLTHCPPEGILDLVSSVSYSAGQNVGCPRLRWEVENRIKPKIHMYGHIHSQIKNKENINGITYSNCCIMDDYYKPTGKYGILNV